MKGTTYQKLDYDDKHWLIMKLRTQLKINVGIEGLGLISTGVALSALAMTATSVSTRPCSCSNCKRVRAILISEEMK